MRSFDEQIELKWQLCRADAQLLTLLDELRAAARDHFNNPKDRELEHEFEQSRDLFALALAVRDQTADYLDEKQREMRLHAVSLENSNF